VIFDGLPTALTDHLASTPTATKPDLLWGGSHLYVASHVFSTCGCSTLAGPSSSRRQAASPIWSASMWDATTSTFRIFKLHGTMEKWSSTWRQLDNRAGTRADVARRQRSEKETISGVDGEDSRQLNGDSMPLLSP